MVAIDKILQYFPEATIVKPIFSKSKKKLKTLPKRVFLKIQYRQLTKLVLRNNTKLQPDKFITFPAAKINTQEGVDFFNELGTDLLITCRAPIISKEIIQTPKIAAINIHYGISPDYRGNDSHFWALTNKDYDNLGGCLHRIDVGVDTGNILAEVYPPLKASDNELSIGIKTSHLLGIAMVNLIKAQEKSAPPIEGKEQKQKGRNYHYTERTVWNSLRLIIKQLNPNYSLPERSQKIITYFKNETANFFS